MTLVGLMKLKQQQKETMSERKKTAALSDWTKTMAAICSEMRSDCTTTMAALSKATTSNPGMLAPEERQSSSHRGCVQASCTWSDV
jgi:hypothetical protein